MATINVRGYGGAGRQSQRVRRLHHNHTPGWIHLMCHMPPLNQRVRLGPEGWKPSDVPGGWDVTGRPRAVGMTTWSGVPPQEGDLHILYNDPDGVEQQIQQLIDVARGTARSEPGVVWLDGIASLPTDRWIIGNLSFGELLIRDRAMRRIRQDVTIHLVEYEPPQYETLRKGALQKPRPKTVIYKVKHGDTPAKIARGRRCKWTALKLLNKRGVIKSANQKLKAGIQIMVPVMSPRKAPKKQSGKR